MKAKRAITIVGKGYQENKQRTKPKMRQIRLRAIALQEAIGKSSNIVKKNR